ncbi:hypothetical protein EYF80_064625 [Liparis tanakae]|uniref:Uncharacterized protein n=1 Tax=Liparis tanakae TaxID=230148 RepID=A0A4Z2E8V4_9TELE|nr:hypothetical protein EYF80_064625 [Liparis tanakae]
MWGGLVPEGQRVPRCRLSRVIRTRGGDGITRPVTPGLGGGFTLHGYPTDGNLDIPRSSRLHQQQLTLNTSTQETLVRHTGQTHWSDTLVRNTGQAHWSETLVRHTGQKHWSDG